MAEILTAATGGFKSCAGNSAGEEERGEGILGNASAQLPKWSVWMV